MALAILTVTLVTAYNISNQSYSEGIQSREHSQAIYLAQEQAEHLYLYRDNLIAKDPGNTAPIMTPFYFSTCSSSCYFQRFATTPSPGPYTPPLFSGVTYHVSIGKPPAGSIYAILNEELAFTITVTWDSAIRTGLVTPQGTNQNSTSLNIIIVDKRGITPRDCSVAGNAQCS
jgi:hypothetical protein